MKNNVINKNKRRYALLSEREKREQCVLNSVSPHKYKRIFEYDIPPKEFLPAKQIFCVCKFRWTNNLSSAIGKKQQREFVTSKSWEKVNTKQGSNSS